MVAVILIHELIETQLLSEAGLSNIEQILQNLPQYYAQLSEEQRLNILKKYIILNKPALYKACEQIARTHNLTFAYDS